MASTKALRDTFGLSQQEMAYFIGASRFQVAHHERTFNNIAGPQEDVLIQIYLLFQQYKDLPDLPDIPKADSGNAIRKKLNKQISDLRYWEKVHSRKRATLQATYLKLKIQLEVLKQLMAELSTQEGILFDGLVLLKSIIQLKMRRCGLDKQLVLSIKIEKILKEIAVNEEFLNHDLLKTE